jgi:quercetin dioxygenase-like cupin family protein
MRPALAALLLISTYAAAQTGASVRYRRAEEVDWKVSGSLPPGAEYHLVYEDKASRGLQTLVRFPSGYALPPHSHSANEVLTVIKGKLVVDYGGEPQTLGPGSYIVIPAHLTHSLKAKGQVVMMMSVDGPYDVLGLSPATP